MREIAAPAREDVRVPLDPTVPTLQTTTLYGAFRLDPVRLRQTGHRVHLVEWRQGRKELLHETTRRVTTADYYNGG